MLDNTFATMTSASISNVDPTPIFYAMVYNIKRKTISNQHQEAMARIPAPKRDIPKTNQTPVQKSAVVYSTKSDKWIRFADRY